MAHAIGRDRLLAVGQRFFPRGHRLLRLELLGRRIETISAVMAL
jgi:hypothetical protein